jgi:catechol 2,3-dioxygenase-like lactoylglutathione lyase family enzyme
MIAAMATTRRADMFTANGKPSDDDPRENGPTLGDERTTLVEALRCQRLTLELKCSGLDAEALARRSVEPSTMSLLGLVRHLAEMERATFRVMMSAQDVPRLFCSDTDRDGDFDGAVADPRVVAEAWEAWRAEVDFATRFVAEAPSLDITGDDPLNQHGSGGGPMSLREVLVGMIEEYARHMGHVDLLAGNVANRTTSGHVYISDPDGNEIELYVDVPGVNWREEPSLLNSASPLELWTVTASH